MALEVLNLIYLIYKAPLKEEGQNKIIAFTTVYCSRFTLKKCKMVSVFTKPDVNTREVGRTQISVGYHIRSCKMVLWPIKARVLFELFYKIM